jgi:hypothetical protein
LKQQLVVDEDILSPKFIFLDWLKFFQAQPKGGFAMPAQRELSADERVRL